MNKGDSIRLKLNFTIGSKKLPIEEGMFSEMELQLNKQTFGQYHVKFLLSKGEIVWDEDLGLYVAYLSQEDSFKLSNEVDYQLRCYNDGVVVSSKIGSFCLGNVLSREVLPYERY